MRPLSQSSTRTVISLRRVPTECNEKHALVTSFLRATPETVDIAFGGRTSGRPSVTNLTAVYT